MGVKAKFHFALSLTVDAHLVFAQLTRPIRSKTCKTGLQPAIFDIQANRRCSKGVGCSARQNTCGNYFVGPKMTPPDPVLTLNLS